MPGGLLVIVLQFVGNILLGVAVWRSGTLPRWAGALWAAAHVLMYLSLVYAQTIGPASTPPTVPVGAVLVVISGGWMAWSVLRQPSVAKPSLFATSLGDHRRGERETVARCGLYFVG
ncbi:MAG: hypothetical protein M3Q62_10080 [Actinomycetota bacterium]|nr:hypothetical protein [Rubrobacteraceae bacterium]MBA3635168.1 hypothetical protein [Rubrobacteraceae bacterium]MBA3702059.1 hypothetical protein [Rubrobacteraceae bacterium]MDQ3183862.1 hypothetical protein [Actinomycetota bacterium]MDQ3495956.1 hypothetical protein [Actinomycetota bacterium]